LDKVELRACWKLFEKEEIEDLLKDAVCGEILDRVTTVVETHTETDG
jgi:hypothetical protein